jgi:hypothetical protein
MRSVILGILIVLAVPAYTVGQQRDRSERSATGRTAVPRDEAVHAAPATQTDRRAEPSRGTRTSSPRQAQSDDSAASRAGRGRGNAPGGARTGGRRVRDEQPRDGDYRWRYRRPQSGSNVVFVPYPEPVVVERQVVVEREVVNEVPVIVERPASARLVLDVHPPTAQVFADGYYIGIPEDFRFENGGAVLEPGPHRIDIVARDYEPVSFDVNLASGQMATFRHILASIPSTPPAARDGARPAKKQPVTFYLIPGCYMGNVPPKEAKLPATCDITRAVSFQY